MTECTPTVNAAAGMSGNNRPFVLVGMFDLMGGKPGCHFTTKCDVCPTITRGRGACSDIHALCYSRQDAKSGGERR